MRSLAIAVVLVTTTAYRAAGFEIIRDSLCMTDLQVYDTYYLNYCGGGALYGESYSMQSAEAFRLPGSYFVTKVTVDFLTVNGVTPDYICASFYENSGGACRVNEDANWSATLDSDAFSWEAFEDTVFGRFEGRRSDVSFSEPPLLSEGVWFGCLQPASEADFAGTPAASYSRALDYDCIEIGDTKSRESREDESCCIADGDWGWWKDWTCDGTFEPDTLSMRVEGIPAGDCVGGEQVRAKCRVRGGEQVGDVVVKVRDGQPNGTVTALLDPPDPRSMSIALDSAGRGKGKFRGVPLGEHRVFVCDSIVNVTCAP